MSAEANNERRLHNADPDYIEPAPYPIEQVRYPTAVFRGDPADGVVENGWKLEGQSKQTDGGIVYLVSKTTKGAPGNPEGWTYTQKPISKDLLDAANQKWEELHPPKPQEVIEQSGEDAVALANDDPAEVFQEYTPNPEIDTVYVDDSETGKFLTAQEHNALGLKQQLASSEVATPVITTPETKGLGGRVELEALLATREPTAETAPSSLRRFELTLDPNKARKNVLEALDYLIGNLKNPGDSVSAEDLVHIASMVMNTPRAEGDPELNNAVEDVYRTCLEMNLDVHRGTDQRSSFGELIRIHDIIQDRVTRSGTEQSVEVSNRETDEQDIAVENSSHTVVDADEPIADARQEQERDDARQDVKAAFTQPDTQESEPEVQDEESPQSDLNGEEVFGDVQDVPEDGGNTEMQSEEEPSREEHLERAASSEHYEEMVGYAKQLAELGQPHNLTALLSEFNQFRGQIQELYDNMVGLYGQSPRMPSAESLHNLGIEFDSDVTMAGDMDAVIEADKAKLQQIKLDITKSISAAEAKLQEDGELAETKALHAKLNEIITGIESSFDDMAKWKELKNSVTQEAGEIINAMIRNSHHDQGSHEFLTRISMLTPRLGESVGTLSKAVGKIRAANTGIRQFTENSSA